MPLPTKDIEIKINFESVDWNLSIKSFNDALAKSSLSFEALGKAFESSAIAAASAGSSIIQLGLAAESADEAARRARAEIVARTESTLAANAAKREELLRMLYASNGIDASQMIDVLADFPEDEPVEPDVDEARPSVRRGIRFE